MNIRQAKNLFRKTQRSSLPKLSQAQIEHQSQAILTHLETLPVYANAKSVSIFLSMQGEISTTQIVKNLLDGGKHVFIPKCDGSVMNMVSLDSFDDFNSLPRNSWGIPEPPENELVKRINGRYLYQLLNSL